MALSSAISVYCANARCWNYKELTDWCVWTIYGDQPVWKCWPCGLPSSASKL